MIIAGQQQQQPYGGYPQYPYSGYPQQQQQQQIYPALNQANQGYPIQQNYSKYGPNPIIIQN